MGKTRSYIGNIFHALGTAMKGIGLSGKHLRKGMKASAPVSIEHPDYFKHVASRVTIQYPVEQIPIPDAGRYRLDMETDDCIGCDKCARICPVNCITITTFKADGELGKTSDGTVKRLHLPVFDIDMAKCMYCGLCTTVCPTECLTMTKVHDFSEFDRSNFLYHFGGMSPEEEKIKRAEVEAAMAAKKAAAAAKALETGPEENKPANPAPRRPLPRKPVVPPADEKGGNV